MSTSKELLDRLNGQRIAAAQRRKSLLERAANGERLSESEERSINEERREIDRLTALIQDEQRRSGEDAEYSEAFNATASRTRQNGSEARYGHPLGNARLTGLPEVRTRSFEDFGRYVRQEAGFEARAASEGTNSAGGFLVPLDLAAPVLDLAVNAMVTREAGARVVAMNTKSLDVPTLNSDPVPSWRAEGAAIAESDPVFGKITLTAKSLSVFTKVSLELLEDAVPNFGEVLASSMARSFALELDRAALYGSGTSNQPTGLKNTAGVTITNFTGANGGTLATTTAGPALAGAVARLKGKNYTPTGQIYSSRTEQQLAGLLDTTNQPLVMPRYITDVPTYVTNAVANNLTLGTSTDVSDYIVGDFSNLVIGLRTEFGVKLNTDALMLSNGQVAFMGWLRADIAVVRPAAFEIVTGLRA